MKYDLLRIIVCPTCLGKLFFDFKNKELVCNIDGMAFPIEQGIPVLLIDKARRLDIQANNK